MKLVLRTKIQNYTELKASTGMVAHAPSKLVCLRLKSVKNLQVQLRRTTAASDSPRRNVLHDCTAWSCKIQAWVNHTTILWGNSISVHQV